MSNRTSEASKAIARAWSNEQLLIREGKGTRDWTPTQQQDILNRGKAYDDDGKAFEGHHMKSAEKFPGYQGDPENIQFLSRTEHLNAHSGNFTIPTNGYYDPVSGETIVFDTDMYNPCEIIELSNPVVIKHDNPKDENDVVQEIDSAESDSGNNPTRKNSSVKPTKRNITYKIRRFASSIGIETKADLVHFAKEKLVKAAVFVLPIVVDAVVDAAVDVVRTRVSERRESRSNSYDYSNDAYAYDSDDHTYGEARDENRASTTPSERSSPKAHIVKKHPERYHTKAGIVIREIEPYPRGKNTDD